jgi:hypothetical protein
MSTIGSFRDASHGTKRMKEIADSSAKLVMKLDWNQSSRWPLSNTISREPSARPMSAIPIQSTFNPAARRSRRSRSRISGSTSSNCTSTNEAMPIGTLMKKIQCHDRLYAGYCPPAGYLRYVMSGVCESSHRKRLRREPEPRVKR